MQWVATDWLRLWGAYGYTDAEFEIFRNCGAAVDCTGNRPVAAPREQLEPRYPVDLPLFGGELFVQAIIRRATSSTRIQATGR